MEEKITIDTQELNGEETEQVISSYSLVEELKSILTPELEKEGQTILEGSSEGRRRCPKCGNANKDLIREIIDKTHIIFAYPRVYGHKYKCGQCGTEWR